MSGGTGESLPVAPADHLQRGEIDKILGQENFTKQQFDEIAGADEENDPEGIGHRAPRCTERSELDEDSVEIGSHVGRGAEQGSDFIGIVVMPPGHNCQQPGQEMCRPFHLIGFDF